METFATQEQVTNHQATRSFMKEGQRKCSYTALLCYPCHRTVYQTYHVSDRKTSISHVNLCKSNVVLIFELSFTIVRDSCLPTILER